MLDVLAESKAIYEHPAALRLRYRNCANVLNRSTQQVERSLVRSLMCDNPDKPNQAPAKTLAAKSATAKAPTTRAAEAPADISLAEAESLIQQTRAEIDSCRNRLSGVRPATSRQPAPGSRASAFMAALHAAWTPPASPG